MISPALARILPFAVFVALLALEPAWPAVASYLGVDDPAEPAWLYTVRTPVTAVVLALLWRHYVELWPGTALRFAPVLEAVAVGLLVWVMWITLGPLLRMGEPVSALPPRAADGGIHPLWLAFRLAGTALVVPLIEELFWRSYLMRRIDAADFLKLAPRAASMTAVLLSSAVFALEHAELLAGFVAGLAYAWLYRRHQDLRLAVIAHGVTNLALGGYVLAFGRYEFW